MSNLPSGEERLRARKPLPATHIAYLATAGSPLKVDQALYQFIQQSPRELIDTFVLPIRSGRAWKAPASSIIRISTPEGPQVGDLNIWNAENPRERFWAARTKQLHSSHVTTYHRLWSCLPYMRPLVTIIGDSLSWYGVDETGGRVHDLLGTRCDPVGSSHILDCFEAVPGPSKLAPTNAHAQYVNTLLSGPEASYDYHCHSNLTRAVIPFGLNESDVHDVINLFQVTGLDSEGRYFLNPCPAQAGDSIEFFAEQDLLMALSTCPGGDLSLWGFGSDSEKEMIKCCRRLKVELFKLVDEEKLLAGKWKPAERPDYRGIHGMQVPEGEKRSKGD